MHPERHRWLTTAAIGGVGPNPARSPKLERREFDALCEGRSFRDQVGYVDWTELNTTIMLCRVIPPFTPAGVLPVGEHPATWQEVTACFGGNPKREILLQGLLAAARSLAAAGALTLWLDGSFVTAKSEPADFDGAWDPAGVDLSRVDPLLVDIADLSSGRQRQKAKYGGELLVGREGASGLPFHQFFQMDKNGDPKGIVVLDLRTLP
jgi:hypothetical protein